MEKGVDMHSGLLIWRRRVLLATAAAALTIFGAVGAAQAAVRGESSATSATLVYAVPSVTTTLDYAPYQGDANRFVDIPLESKLVLYDPSKLKGKGCYQLASVSDIRGDLATSWSYSKDRKTITLKLRNARSQYGNVLTADDVKWSINRSMAISPIAAFNYFTIAHYRKIDPVTVVNSRTVQLHVDQPTALDLIENTVFFAVIYDSREALKHATSSDPWATAWLQTHTDTFGPWEVSDFQPGQQVTYVPNPYYYGKSQRGNITKFIIRQIPDAATRVQLLQAGQVDWAARLSFNDYLTLNRTHGVTVKKCLSPNRDDIVLNIHNPILSKTQVRQAISMALDRRAIAKGAYLGFGQPARSGLSQWYSYPKPTATYSYNPQQAKQLLAQAGYPNGFDLNMLYSPTRPGPVAEQSAILIQSMLGAIGIRVHLTEDASGTDFSSKFLAGNFDAIVWQEPPLIADPYFSASIYNISNSFQNHFGFNDPGYDKFVLSVGTTPPGKKRAALMAKLAGLGVTDYPVIYLTDDFFMQGFRSNISGYLATPDGEVYPETLVKR